MNISVAAINGYDWQSSCDFDMFMFIEEWAYLIYLIYRKVSNIRRTKSQNLKWFSSRLEVVFTQSVEAGCQVENEDVVGAAPIGNAPITSEWSWI